MKLLILLLIFASSAAAAPPGGRDVDIIASDGTILKATYFAARPGPAVLLMHNVHHDASLLGAGRGATPRRRHQRTDDG